MKIVIAGATGFIGRPLAEALQRDGHDVVALTRDASGAARSVPAGARAIAWDAQTADGPWAAELRGAGAVVNLAGASIGGGRWTAHRKQLLSESRLRATGALVAAIAALGAGERPAVLVNASGIDYYGDQGTQHEDAPPLDESAAPGTSFLAQLCVEWEAAARKAEPLGVRVVLMRTAFVVGRGAAALRMMVLPFRLFVGGPLGSGRQRFTWIQLDDLVALYKLAIENAGLSGPLNAVAPQAPPQHEVAREIGHVLHRPSFAPAPAFVLRLVLGEMADLLLHGRRAIPAKAESAGFRFRYHEIGPALTQALQ